MANPNPVFSSKMMQKFTNIDSPMLKSFFTSELISDPDEENDLKVRLCTGTEITIPRSLVKKVSCPVVSRSVEETRVYACISFDTSTPEGRLVCELAAEIESLTSLNRTNNKSNQLFPGTTVFASGDMKVFLSGTACNYRGNITNVFFDKPITSYSLGQMGGDEGVFIVRHRKLNSTTVEIAHDRTAVCGTSYQGSVIVYYDSAG